LSTAFIHLKVSKDCLTGNMYIRSSFPWPKNEGHLAFALFDSAFVGTWGIR